MTSTVQRRQRSPQNENCEDGYELSEPQTIRCPLCSKEMLETVLCHHLDQFLPPNPEVDSKHPYEATKHARDAVPSNSRDSLSKRITDNKVIKRKVLLKLRIYLLFSTIKYDVNIFLYRNNRNLLIRSTITLKRAKSCRGRRIKLMMHGHIK